MNNILTNNFLQVTHHSVVDYLNCLDVIKLELCCKALKQTHEWWIKRYQTLKIQLHESLEVKNVDFGLYPDPDKIRSVCVVFDLMVRHDEGQFWKFLSWKSKTDLQQSKHYSFEYYDGRCYTEANYIIKSQNNFDLMYQIYKVGTQLLTQLRDLCMVRNHPQNLVHGFKHIMKDLLETPLVTSVKFVFLMLKPDEVHLLTLDRMLYNVFVYEFGDMGMDSLFKVKLIK